MTAPPVILLHGLRHTRCSMRLIQKALQQAGKSVFNISYPSGRYEIEQLACRIWDEINAHCSNLPDRLDFVGHSMGCILTRIIDRDHPSIIRRAVMLAPPNHGSELVDRFKQFMIARWIMGPGGLSLGIGNESILKHLGPPGFEAGIIAGSRPDNPFARWFIPGVQDGRVSVERTRLDAMADHIVVPHGHFFIMRKADVISQTLHFLEHGCFRRKNGHHN